MIPSHVGLGSTTTTTMAALQSIALVNSWPQKSIDLVELSGRGRTSGVGAHTFFTGGLVVDVGQPGHPVRNYLPSLQPEERAPSLVLGRWDMPNDWVVHLFFTSENPSVAPAEESAFFASAAPTDEAHTLYQIACLYHGVLPAILERDLEVLAESLKEFQTRGFKACEIAAQNEHVRNALSILWDSGIAAGLSSFGPTVFAIEERGKSRVRDLFSNQISILGPFGFRNDGYEHS
jgi:beta-ribofuranosylaminobenzene 5'-phosphate synthase